jgi:hypothetical protein
VRIKHILSQVRRSAWTGRVVGIIFLVGVCGAAYYVGMRQHETNVRSEGLYIDAKHLDFGEVWEQTRFRWTLPIENRTDSVVDIADWSLGCNCMEATPRQVTLLPGQTVQLQLALDLTIPPNARSPRPLLPEGSGSSFTRIAGDVLPRSKFSARVAPILSKAPVQPLGWALSGTVKAAFRLPANGIVDFGETLVKGKPFPTKELNIHADIECQSVNVTCASGNVDIATEPSRKKQEYIAELTPRPTLNLGPMSEKVVVRAIGRDGQELASTKLLVRGLVVEPIEALPSSILLGAIKLRVPVNLEIVLRARNDERFEVIRAETALTGLKVKQSALPTDRQRVILAELEPNQLGQASGSLKVHYRISKDAESRVLDVPVSYLGLRE